MKKVLSFVLVLSMILGSFDMAFAAPADVEGSEYKDALTVLLGLGVIDGYTDGTVKPEKVVTRAEAATLIIKAMNLQDYAVGKSAFTDMAGHWADAFVAYATSLGFVKGNTDGTFAPDAPVTSDQMITMLVQALGYKAEYLTGTYPGAFVNTAKALGMLEGVKSGNAGCTRGEVAQLIYNSLDARFVSYDKDGGIQYTVMGVVDTMMKRLVGAASTAAITVKADEPSLIGLKDFQGAYVEVIKNDEGKIVAIDEVKSVFLKGDLEATKFVLDDADEFVLVGVDALEDIKEKNIVAYYNDGTDLAKIEVGTKTVEGKVTINGEAYKVNASGAAVASDVVVYAVDKEGNISVSEVGKIKKDYEVRFFELDADVEGFDAIVYLVK